MTAAVTVIITATVVITTAIISMVEMKRPFHFSQSM
jgi:drug/metabolite transporter (DMT)-like permease